MNKNILIITPFFPPQTHAAVFRAFKLVKYLKRTGWNPIVLTVNRNYLYLEDPDLLDEVQDVPIYQANYIEPTLRGLRMLLGGEDTSLKAITAKAKTIGAQSKSTDTVTSNKQSLFGKFYKYILDRWIQVPDRFRFWERSAVRMGRKIIKEHDISIIYTTCLPFTSNRIGMRLKHLTGVKWVADFRDPTTYAKRMYSDYFPVFAKQKKIEQDTFKYADAITGLSGAYLNIFNDLYEGRYSNKSYFIPTGVDDDYLPSFQNREKENYIIFVGEYLHEYKDNFLKIFAEAVNSKELKGKGCTLKIVGNKNINQKQTEEFVNDLGICNNVEYINHVPQRKLYELIVNAKAAVLIPGHTALWWTNFAKMVDYIALQVPVLAMVPMTSEARTELIKAGIGIFIDTPQQGVTVIKQVFSEKFPMTANKEYCRRYLASQQTKSFIDIFQKITFDFTFGFVGRIFYEKGINELVASFIRLQKDYPNIGLRLIGFMEENLYPVDDWVKQEISTNSHIEFVGFQQDVRPYLMGCEAFVFPSYREGFPNVVMQAGALELPQIVTDINGCNEIIVQNKNGIIVPPQDEHALYKAMKYFLDNPNEVKRMAKNARAMITSRYERNKFWKLMLEEYYRQIKNRIK